MAALRAQDLMTTPVATTSPEATLGEVARFMIERNVSCLPVVAGDGSLVGIITHTDFTPRERHLPFSAERFYSVLGEWVSKVSFEEEFHKLASKRVSEVMSHPVVTLGADSPLGLVAETMYRRNIHRLPLLQEGKLAGIITRHDLIKLVAAEVAKNARAESDNA